MYANEQMKPNIVDKINIIKRLGWNFFSGTTGVSMILNAYSSLTSVSINLCNWEL